MTIFRQQCKIALVASPEKTRQVWYRLKNILMILKIRNFLHRLPDYGAIKWHNSGFFACLKPTKFQFLDKLQNLFGGLSTENALTLILPSMALRRKRAKFDTFEKYPNAAKNRNCLHRLHDHIAIKRHKTRFSCSSRRNYDLKGWCKIA